ncbi:hypothetical protein HPP92_017616 [Vanilla planifolia]|uniref:FHA domain-containing protein n=1 Tax=Vanilla planifolia TaxID=51239 RepID=A0A835QD31_VANPL|nr:hypothetical protein HPP92_017616 [Vanilla planifolia]
MANSRVKIGLLFPLQSNIKTENLTSGISIFEGVNFVGRQDITKSDKRISRKHVSMHGSSDGIVELIVEGPNPIVFKSGGQKRKLCSQERAYLDDGDILEFIPGNHSFKYVKIATEPPSSSGRALSFSEQLRHVDVKSLVNESKHQILHCEASARMLQNSECCNLLEVDPSVTSKSVFSQPTSETYMISPTSMEAISQFDSGHRVSHVFHLMRVKGLPEWANKTAVSIHDVIEGNILVAILSNYMVDIDWLKTACPMLWEIPHVLVIHGESGARLIICRTQSLQIG